MVEMKKDANTIYNKHLAQSYLLTALRAATPLPHAIYMLRYLQLRIK